jgi:hypothetical protein
MDREIEREEEALSVCYSAAQTTAASLAAHRRVPFGHLPGASRARARIRPRGQARATLASSRRRQTNRSLRLRRYKHLDVGALFLFPLFSTAGQIRRGCAASIQFFSQTTPPPPCASIELGRDALSSPELVVRPFSHRGRPP